MERTFSLVIQYIPRNMHTVLALLCFVVVIYWLIFPYPSGLLHWHCGNLTIAPVPAKQPWWIWINTSCEFIMNDCITTTKQSTTKPCAYFSGYTVCYMLNLNYVKWCHISHQTFTTVHLWLGDHFNNKVLSKIIFIVNKTTASLVAGELLTAHIQESRICLMLLLLHDWWASVWTLTSYLLLKRKKEKDGTFSITNVHVYFSRIVTTLYTNKCFCETYLCK